MSRSKFVFLTIFVFAAACLYAQNGDLAELTFRHFDHQKKGMIVLGAWGLGNALIGGIGMYKSSNPEVRAFHQMNFGWGIVNTAIAGFGYYSASNGQLDQNALDLLFDNQKLKSILLLNTGLDVAYMTAGLLMIEKSKNASFNPDRWRGFGKSLIMQGAFLFAFDLGMYFNFKNNTSNIIQLINKGSEIGLIVNF